MHSIQTLLVGIHSYQIIGNDNISIVQICFNSCEATSGALFIACKGTITDGHTYIAQAIELGSRAILCEQLPEELYPEITYIVVSNSAQALGIISSNFYGTPSKKLKLIAVTGTNGKTSTVHLLYGLFTHLGYTVGMLSTIYNKIGNTTIASTHTTPDALQINKLLASMVATGCQYCFMEVSSHAIAQERIAGLHFTGGVFLNITHDHLNYHKSFSSYIQAKKKLFDQLPSNAFALYNLDDKRGMIMVQNTKATKYGFSLSTVADFTAKVFSITLQGMELLIGDQSVWVQLIGAFNANNILAAYATAYLLGISYNDILVILSILPPILGRMNIMFLTQKQYYVIIDYAHTPDGLKQILTTIQTINVHKGKIITVVGSGGNKDKKKRSIIGQLACKWSDYTIFTSDNPRNEAVEIIIADMKKNVTPTQQKRVLEIADRESAIKTACFLAKKNDIILLAGKGHENYQEVRGIRAPFSEYQIIKNIL